MKKIDYSSFSDKGTPGQTQENTLQKRWWFANKTDRANAVQGVVKLLNQYDSKRQSQYQVGARLYGNIDLIGLNGLSFSMKGTTSPALKERISFNVIQACTDTITAKMAKTKPRPLFLTSGGDWKTQRKAKKLDKFVEGIFYENKAYALGIEAFRDGVILGDGLIHVYDEHDRVKFERVLPHELFVDHVEAFYGFPRQLHRVKTVDREVLIDLFPSKRNKILEANSASGQLGGDYQNVADQVQVIESWHLPSGPDAGDGIHCITIPGETLFEEEWEHDFFPFARFTWSKRMAGYWGQGGAEQIQNIQLEINKLLWVIQRSFHLAGTFKVFIENSSKIVKEHLNNDIGAIVTYQGTPPQYAVAPTVQPEIFQHLQTLKNSAFEQFGISQMSSASLKPAGLNSGKALREYNDIETERFMTIGQAYEQFYLDLARLTVWKAREIYGRNKEYSVSIPGKKFIESIDWSDIDLEDDDFTLKIFPVSSLPSDPSGRLQTVQEYIQAGMLSPRQGRRLLDFPDLEQVESLQNAGEDYLHKILERMTDEEFEESADELYTPPEPVDDLALSKELVLEYIAQGKLNGLGEERMELLRKFNDQIDMIQQAAQAAQAPPAGGMPPQAAPMAPPQSDLVQNVPGVM